MTLHLLHRMSKTTSGAVSDANLVKMTLRFECIYCRVLLDRDIEGIKCISSKHLFFCHKCNAEIMVSVPHVTIFLVKSVWEYLIHVPEQGGIFSIGFILFKYGVHSVQIGFIFFRELNLMFVVPQGSVPGPVLFTMYTTPLDRTIQSHELIYHLYADDTQLYIAIKPSDAPSIYAKSQIESCVADIQINTTTRLFLRVSFYIAYMDERVNGDKTKFLIITTHENISKRIKYISLGER